MRSNKALAIGLFSVCLSLVAAAPSFALLPDTLYFDFTGWDHDLVTSESGQTFMNVIGDIDVTVMATNANGFTWDTRASGMDIESGNVTPGTNTFKFTFTESLRLVVQQKTTDSQEVFGVFGIGDEAYVHDFGAPPTVSDFNSGIHIAGNGVGISPTGASRGETIVGPTNLLTVTHQGLFNNKFETFMVGTIIPEPSSCSLIGIGFFGMLMSFRKRRS